jgi:hypothetical protein
MMPGHPPQEEWTGQTQHAKSQCLPPLFFAANPPKSAISE